MKRPIITLEDGTEVLETTGDLDALEYGGGVLFREPRRRDVFWSFWSERPDGQKFFELFTAPVPSDIIEFFKPDLKEIALVSGIELRDIRRLAKSKNPVERLEIVQAIRDCNGPSSVDPSRTPERVSPFEMANRWGAVFDVAPEGVPMIEMDDFLVRETKYGNYECGCVDGNYLGRFDTFKKALCAVADYMHQHGLAESNLYHEHEFGKLELVGWEPETFIGKLPRRRGKLPESPWRNLMKKYINSETRKKGVGKRLKAQKQVVRQRQRRMAKSNQQARIERARDFRRAASEKY